MYSISSMHILDKLPNINLGVVFNIFIASDILLMAKFELFTSICDMINFKVVLVISFF